MKTYIIHKHKDIRKILFKKRLLQYFLLFIFALLIVTFLLQLPKNSYLSQNLKNFSSVNPGISFNHPDNMIIYEHIPDYYDDEFRLSLVSKEIPNPKSLYDDSNAICVGYKAPMPAGGSEPNVLKGYFMSIRMSNFSISDELRKGYELSFEKITVDGYKAYKKETVFRCGLKLGKAVRIIVSKNDSSMIINISYPIGFNNYSSTTDRILSSVKLTSF